MNSATTKCQCQQTALYQIMEIIPIQNIGFDYNKVNQNICFGLERLIDIYFDFIFDFALLN